MWRSRIQRSVYHPPSPKKMCRIFINELLFSNEDQMCWFYLISQWLCLACTCLHLYSQHCGLSGHTEDVFVAEPEITTDCPKTAFVLLPVTVKACQADLASLNDSPATTVVLHVTEHLKNFKKAKINDWWSFKLKYEDLSKDSGLRWVQVFQGSHLSVVCTLQKFCSFCCKGMRSHRWHLK